MEKKLSFYVEEEVNKVSKILIRDILDKEFLKQLDMIDLFEIQRNSNNEIEMINFNTIKINEILGIVNDEVIYYFDEFDKGNMDLIYDSRLFERYDEGMYLSVPLGSILKNPIINSIGPKIPVKLFFSGDVESNVVTSVKQYGINSILLEIDIEIVVTEKIIFPFSSKYVDVILEVPLIIELISGKVPESYLNNEKFGIIE